MNERQFLHLSKFLRRNVNIIVLFASVSGCEMQSMTFLKFLLFIARFKTNPTCLFDVFLIAGVNHDHFLRLNVWCVLCLRVSDGFILSLPADILIAILTWGVPADVSYRHYDLLRPVKSVALTSNK